jgi:hypothetical protein
VPLNGRVARPLNGSAHVEDDGGRWSARADPDDRPHGLDIVRALAADSGIDGDPVTGWVAWARLDVTGAGTDGQGTDGQGRVRIS